MSIFPRYFSLRCGIYAHCEDNGGGDDDVHGLLNDNTKDSRSEDDLRERADLYKKKVIMINLLNDYNY